MHNEAVVCDCDVIHSETVEIARASMPLLSEMQDVADFFKVLGDNTRIKMMIALDQNEMCVCDLSVLLNMTKSAISHQLGKLRQMKVVKFRRDGKNIYYSLDDDHVKDIIEKAFTHIRHQ